MFFCVMFVLFFFYLSYSFSFFFFFFQAEDGIRDGTVTGVQTCALPIWQTVPCDPPSRASTGAVAIHSECRFASLGGARCTNKTLCVGAKRHYLLVLDRKSVV